MVWPTDFTADIAYDPIRIGYAWYIEIEFEPDAGADIFKSGDRLDGAIISLQSIPSALALISTTSGELTVIADNILAIKLTASITAALPAGRIGLDIVGINSAGTSHLGAVLNIDVEKPIRPA